MWVHFHQAAELSKSFSVPFSYGQSLWFVSIPQLKLRARIFPLPPSHWEIQASCSLLLLACFWVSAKQDCAGVSRSQPRLCWLARKRAWKGRIHMSTLPRIPLASMDDLSGNYHQVRMQRLRIHPRASKHSSHITTSSGTIIVGPVWYSKEDIQGRQKGNALLVLALVPT